MLVAIVVVPHALDGAADPCMSARNLHSRIEEVKVRQLAVDAVVNNVQLVEALSPGSGRVIYSDGSLKSSGFDFKRGYGARVVSVVVSINPGLWSKSTI